MPLRVPVPAVLAAAILVTGAARSAAREPREWIGARVVTEPGTLLTAALPRVDTANRPPEPQKCPPPRARVYLVDAADGPWLRLAAENDADSGWAPAAQVVAYDRAIDHFTNALRATPASAAAALYNARGVVWASQGQRDKALADFTEAIRLDPRLQDAYCHRPELWIAIGEHIKAIADCNLAIPLAPKDPRAYTTRARALEATGSDDKAIADYSAAIQLDPSRASAFRDRAYNWRRKGEYARALADYDEAVRLDPSNPWGHDGRAWIQATCPVAGLRDGRLAVASATHACALTGWKDAFFLESLAAAFAETGDFPNAVKWQEKALALYTSDEDRQYGRTRLALFRANRPYHSEPSAK